MSAPQMRLLKWTPRPDGSLIAFFSVELASGLVLNGLRLMAKEGGFWVAMPAQKQTNRDGTDRLDAKGKPIYTQPLEFKDRATSDRFRDAVLDLLRRECPEAIGGTS